MASSPKTPLQEAFETIGDLLSKGTLPLPPQDSGERRAFGDKLEDYTMAAIGKPLRRFTAVPLTQPVPEREPSLPKPRPSPNFKPSKPQPSKPLPAKVPSSV